MEILNQSHRQRAIWLTAESLAEANLCGLDDIPLTDHTARRALTEQAKARAYLFIDDAEQIVSGIVSMVLDEVADEATG